MATAQTDDFNDGNDTGWTRYDPGSQLTALGAPFNVPGVFSFPSGGYRLQGTAIPAAFLAGPARLGAYWDNVVFTNGQVGADLVSWNDSQEMAFGFILRVSNIGLGSTEGYTINYLSAAGELEVNRVFMEASAATVGSTTYRLNPADGPFRLITEAYGSLMVGRIFRASDLSAPIVSVIANDATYSEGKAGLFSFDDGPAPDMTPALDVTFDNYSAASLPKYRPLLTELQPRPYSVGGRFGEIKVAILDRETTVDTTSIVLTVNGVAVPSASLTITPEVLQPGNATPFPGATVTYKPASLPNLSDTQTNRVVFKDSDGVFQTNTWTYKYAVLDPGNAAPADRGVNPGFDVRFVITSTNVPALTNIPNNLARALTQLGPTPPPGWADFQTSVIAAVINYTQKDTNSGTDGRFPLDYGLSGIDPFGLAMLDKEKFGKNIPGHEQQKTQAWKDCERYTRLAAEQGDPASQFALGKLYFHAIEISGGVLRAADAERMGKSIRWNRKAAAQGHEPSIEQLQWFDEYFPNIVKVVDAQDAAGMDVRF